MPSNFIILLNIQLFWFTAGEGLKRVIFVTIRKRFPLIQTIEDINFCLEALSIYWIIFTLDLVISYTDKLLVFRWVQIVLLL